MPADEKKQSSQTLLSKLLLAPFLIGAMLVLMLGGWVYEEQKQALRRDVAGELDGIAKGKIEQILAWRHERLGNGLSLGTRPTFVDLVNRWSSGSEENQLLEAQILGELKSTGTYYDYADIALADAQQQIRFTLHGQADAVSKEVARGMQQASLTQQPVLTDLYRTPLDHSIAMDVVVPVICHMPEPKLLGYVLLRINPSLTLYGITQTWPHSTRTGEVIIARRDGDSVLYLNDLRRNGAAALSLRVSLTNRASPTVQAVLGHEGIIAGKDYSGVSVLASTHAIPGTSWSLITKVDNDEIGERWRTLGLLIAAVALLIATGLLGAAVFIRLLHHRYLKLQQASQLLCKQEARFQAIFNNAPDAYLILELDGGRISACNRATEVMLAGTRTQILGKTPDQLSPERQANGCLSKDAAADWLAESWLSGGNNFEWIHRKLNGIDFWAHVTASVFTIDDRQALLVCWRDITARKEAEAALQESEQRFRLLVEGVRDYAIFQLDPDGRVLTWNSGAERLKGYPAEEIIGQHFSKFYSAEDIAAGKPDHELQAALAEGRHEDEGWRVRKDGSRFWANAVITTLRDKAGHVRGFAKVTRDITERKRAENELADALKQRERILAFNKGLLSAIPTPVYYKDREGRFQGCNRAYTNLMGITPEEMEGKTFEELRPGELSRIYLQQDLEVMASQTRQIYESKVQDKNGETRPIIFAKDVFRDEDGQVAGVVGAFVDITEQKRAEKRIAELSYMLQLVLDSMPAFVFWKSRNGTYLGCNRAFAKDAGLSSAGKIVGLTDFDLPWNRDQAKRYEADDRAVMESGQPKLNFEEALHTADGRDIWLRASKIPLKDVAGNIIGVLGAYEDITERKQAETELRDSRQRVRLAVETTQVGIWEWNLKTNLVHGDAQIFRIYGLPASADGLVPITEWQKAVLPEDLPQQEATLRDMIQRQGQSSSEFRIRRKNDGAIRYIHAMGTVRLNQSGIPEWVVGTNFDVTERIQSEVEQQKLVVELKRSNADLEQFAYVASHDLKSPLRAIDSLSAWLEEDLQPVLTDDSRKYLALMRQRVSRMERLLDDLLAYSRAGRVKESLSTVDVARLVQDIAQFINLPAGFAVRLNGPAPVFVTAATPLRTVLLNLISNAVKHHDRKTGAIEVSVQERGAFYLFVVADDGPGIPPEFHERIWGMFQTLRSRDEVEGSGIGLALVRRLVTHYGGLASVACRQPRGSIFQFAWPKEIVNL